MGFDRFESVQIRGIRAGFSSLFIYLCPAVAKTNRPPLRKFPERRAVWVGKLNFLFLGRGGGSLGGGRFGGALLEFIHAAGGVHELLLAGVKRMAHVADADDDGGLGGTRFDHVATGATDFRVRIFRMNVCFHKKGQLN